MNKSTLFLSGIVTIVYILFRFIEMRFILKENKPLKILFRDGLLVFLSVLLGGFIQDQISNLNKLKPKVTEAFIGEPNF